MIFTVQCAMSKSNSYSMSVKQHTAHLRYRVTHELEHDFPQGDNAALLL